MKSCLVEGCTRPVDARGLCGTHYMQQRRAGVIPVGTRARGSLEERFWRFVQKSDGCWLWLGGSKAQKGYGKIQQGGKGSPHLLAHRVSYEIHNGPIPSGMFVLHKCDNPQCVNPGHLRVGTGSENIKEAFDKGRKVCRPPHKFGEGHSRAQITDADVAYIRSAKGKTIRALAKEMGLTESTVGKVRRRVTWTHLP